MIYLDHHSATRPCSAALDRMTPYFRDLWGAPSSPHRFGQELQKELAACYSSIYASMGADPKDLFVFTSSGAEAVNQALWSVFLEVARKEGKTHFIASCLEDAPTMQALKRLEELGCTVKIAPVDKGGRIDLDRLAALINPRTALISVTAAQGLTGVVQPIEEIAKLAKEKGVLLHVEGTYALGKIYVSFAEMGADYFTVSGDRIHAVKSSGGLFAKAGRPLVPLILGGSEQGGLRGGACDVPSLMAFAAAWQQASLYLDAMNLETARLRDLLESEVARLVPGTAPCFAQSLRLPNTTALCFPKVHQEALLYALSRKGVFAAIGGSYGQHLSRLLAAAEVPGREAATAVSFSLSRMTTEEEILKAAAWIGEAAHVLMAFSEDLL